VNVRRGGILAALLVSGALCLTTHPLSAGEFVIPDYRSEALRPEPDSSFHNPAFAYLSPEIDQRLGFRVPLGLLAIVTVPERNPFLYGSQPDVFRERFDFLSFYDQLLYPGTFLFNPGTSPEEIVAQISKQSFSVETGTGSQLFFDIAEEGDGVARPFTPLIPPPLAQYSHRWTSRYHGELVTTTGVFMAPSGHSLQADAAMEEILQGSDTRPEQEYGFAGSATTTGGVSQSVSYPFPISVSWGSLIVAPRLLGYYRAVTAQGRWDATITTDENSIPSSVETDEDYFLSYPGNGVGYGGRVDLGAAFSLGRFRGGLSVLNAIGFDRVTGTVHEPSKEPTATTIQSSDSAPVAVAVLEYARRVGAHTIVAASDATIGDGVSGRAALTLIRGPWLLRGVAGYRRGWEAAITAGLRSARARRVIPRPIPARLAVSLNFHQSPFTRTSVWGIGLRVGL
jgi:hypothetical protein